MGMRDVAVATLHHNKVYWFPKLPLFCLHLGLKVLPDTFHDAMLRAVDEHATLVAAAVFSAPETLVLACGACVVFARFY